MKVLITGGGTGGHVFPGLAIVEELRRRDNLLLVQWVGKKHSLEEQICKKHGIPFRPIPSRSWPRNKGLSQLTTLTVLGFSILRSFQILHRFQPQIVIGVGGYISFPVTWTAQQMGFPTVIHEQNAQLGLANRMLAKKANRVFLSFPLNEHLSGELGPRDKFIHTGNPIRHAFLNPPDKETACGVFNLRTDLKTILVMGGSQGAKTLNHSLAEMILHLNPNECQIIWITGQHEFNTYKPLEQTAGIPLRIFGFYEDMPTAMACADLIVARAGASTLAEITVMGKPSILVPFPFATDNHQEHNARMLEKTGACRVILDKDCTGETLLQAIRTIINNDYLLQTMGHSAKKLGNPFSAEKIAEEIIHLLFGPRAS